MTGLSMKAIAEQGVENIKLKILVKNLLANKETLNSELRYFKEELNKYKPKLVMTQESIAELKKLPKTDKINILPFGFLVPPIPGDGVDPTIVIQCAKERVTELIWDNLWFDDYKQSGITYHRVRGYLINIIPTSGGE